MRGGGLRSEGVILWLMQMYVYLFGNIVGGFRLGKRPGKIRRR